MTALAGLVLAGVAVAAVASARNGSAASPASQQATGPTVTVTRGDLLQTQQLTGAVGYGSPVQVTGQGGGIITWLPSAGLTVKRGGQLYRVDDQPVSLLYGGLPLYRTLTRDPGAAGKSGPAAGSHGATGAGGAGGATPDSGSFTAPASPVAAASSQPLLSGHDVDLVAANMAALGFYRGPVTGVVYGRDLARAVEQWQASIGAQATGVLTPGSVVVTAGPVRVDGVAAQVGDTVSAPVLTLTSTSKVITLQASAAVAQSLTIGTHIAVTLGDGTAIATRVKEIGSAKAATDGSPASTPVTLRPQRMAALAKAPLGPVTAQLVTASAKDVLHVPVAALLALSGGGYAVELTDKSLVRVAIGMVADGDVEVSGVPAGTKVLVAQ